MKNEENWLNERELALIFDISVKTIKMLVKEGELPCKFVNRQPRFKLNVLIKHFKKLEGGAA